MDQHIAEPGVNFPVEAAHINSKRYFVVKDRVPTDDEGYIGDVCFVISEEKNTPPEPEVLPPFELIRTVEFTSATKIEVDDVFSSEFRNYVVSVQKSMTDQISVKGRLRLSGSDATATNYTFQLLRANGSSVSGERFTTQDHVRVSGGGSSYRDGVWLAIYGPALAQPTAFRSNTVDSYELANLDDLAGTHSLSKAYDGITLYPGSGSMTGYLQVYGVRS